MDHVNQYQKRRKRIKHGSVEIRNFSLNIEKYKFRNSKQPCNVLLYYIKRNENQNHFTTKFFLPRKAQYLSGSIATVTFSWVKISCFWAKVVYNNIDYLMLKVNFMLQTFTKQGKKCNFTLKIKVLD